LTKEDEEREQEEFNRKADDFVPEAAGCCLWQFLRAAAVLTALLVPLVLVQF
jgi:hypothetical protein